MEFLAHLCFKQGRYNESELLHKVKNFNRIKELI